MTFIDNLIQCVVVLLEAKKSLNIYVGVCTTPGPDQIGPEPAESKFAFFLDRDWTGIYFLKKKFILFKYIYKLDIVKINIFNNNHPKVINSRS